MTNSCVVNPILDYCNIIKNKRFTYSALIRINNKIVVCERNNSFVFNKISEAILRHIVLNEQINPNYHTDLLRHLLKYEKQIILNIIRRARYFLFSQFDILVEQKFDGRMDVYKNVREIIHNFKDIIKVKRYYNNYENYFLIAWYVHKMDIKLSINPEDKNNLFILPGGRMEKCDKGLYFNTIKREVGEEISLDLSNTKYKIGNVYHVKIWDEVIKESFTNYVFVVDIVGDYKFNRVKYNNEIRGIRWLECDDEEAFLENIFLVYE